MDELRLLRDFRGRVPGPDDASRRRAGRTLMAKLDAAAGARPRRFGVPRRAWAVALGVLLVVVLVATAAFAANRLLDLFDRVSGSNELVSTSRFSLEDRRLLRRAGAIGVQSVKQLGSEGPLAYYAVRRKDGNTCFVTGPARDRPHLSSIDCPTFGRRFRFPSARTPILDHSVFGGRPPLHLTVLTGIAADGVARVGVLDQGGRVSSTRVHGNVYYTTALPKTELRAIVALDAAGRRIYTLPLASAATRTHAPAVADAQAVLRRFMQARIDRDDDTVVGLMSSELRRAVLAGKVDAPTFQLSNPCWYRYDLLQLEHVDDRTVSERVRVYEHYWPGDVGGGPPGSWEQSVGLVNAGGSWHVDRLGPEQDTRREPTEPHGPHKSACNSVPHNLPQG
jgi:hypothetical protein